MKKLLKIGVGILIFIIIAVAVVFAWKGYEASRTKAAIDRIHATKITMADVMGENLPPKPDQALNDATVEGIDANNNLIRDDVELYIFEQYPNSAKVRAAMLQYAQAVQIELTQVFNSDTYIASIVKETNGSLCIVESSDSTKIRKDLDQIIINSALRTQKREQNAENYLRTYMVDNVDRCDIDNTLFLN